MMWILSPLSWLLLAGVMLIPALRFRSRRRWPLFACCALAFAGYAGATPLVANALVAELEATPTVRRDCQVAPPTVAVVLAGGVDALQLRAGDDSVLNLASRRRMDAGIAYWRAAKGRALVITGTSDPVMDSDARLMTLYTLRRGVPAHLVRLEEVASTTWENAARVAAMVPAIPRRITLVTSALHMPRALYSFEAAGFHVCPLPADRTWLPVGLPTSLVPRSSALVKTEAVLHELVGLAYYRSKDHAASTPPETP
ncbi:YdcF family protein [Thermomonas sp.]